MIEISLNNYNEMRRYEPAMDRLRALALYIAEREIPKALSASGSSKEDLFLLIKHFSKVFAQDIEEHGQVTDEAVSRLISGIDTDERNLGITQKDIEEASRRQFYIGSGFWEMRRFLGQFGDIAEELASNPPDNIIAAGISGCVIAEYLGIKMEKKFGILPDIAHMVFSRDGVSPSAGFVSRDFRLKGRNILLVEDAVDEPKTLEVMTETLSKLDGGLTFDLFALAIAYNGKTEGILGKMAKIYTFDE